jgi:hypothetical protein
MYRRLAALRNGLPDPGPRNQIGDTVVREETYQFADRQDLPVTQACDAIPQPVAAVMPAVMPAVAAPVTTVEEAEVTTETTTQSTGSGLWKWLLGLLGTALFAVISTLGATGNLSLTKGPDSLQINSDEELTKYLDATGLGISGQSGLAPTDLGQEMSRAMELDPALRARIMDDVRATLDKRDKK